MTLETEIYAFVLVTLAASLPHVGAVDYSQCIAPLGMESGLIKDQDISVSSTFDHKYVGARHARIRTENEGGAWCPQSQADPDTKEWIEIDLHSVHLITATETQGRFGNGQGVEYSEAYKLEYYRPRLNKWIRYRAETNEDVLKGNINTYLESKTVLSPPILVSKLRFLPFSLHKRTVCMRVEVYGCKWSDGIVSYSMPQGDKRNSWEFYDSSYDGHWDGEKLKYGLGQLTDGQIAPDDFKLSFHESGQGWVGWRNDTRDNKPVEIIFEFDKIREFTAVNIYTNNQFTKEVQVFNESKVFFSIGGKRYKGEPITYDSFEDKIMETPRNVSIKLHHRVGRFVKVQLYFSSRWILISEVSFESSPVTGNFSEEDDLPEASKAPTDDFVALSGRDNTKKVISAVNNQSGFGQYLGIMVGLFMVLVVFLVAVVSYVLYQHRRYKSSPRPSQVPDKAALYRPPSLGHLTTTSSDYADYAEPLQRSQTSRTPPDRQLFFPKPPLVPPPSEQHYAATDVCKSEYKPQFTPPPPPLSTPPPVRLLRQPRYVSGRTYVGP
ncbi:discoidin domain-containing receptor 2-like [Euwallacea fornicatus]|uniref:discoidin domain-containing receptor 2-like n=1 Tax=Euwallacea fornicatus TaxID=995702 RepID=UPI00339050D6